MWRKLCILALTSWLFLEEHILKICSVNPGQEGFHQVMESFFLLHLGFKDPFLFKFLKLSTWKLITMTRQLSKYLYLSYLIENNLTKMRRHSALMK